MKKTKKFLSLLLTPALVGFFPIAITSCSNKNKVQDNGLTKQQNDVLAMITILGIRVPLPIPTNIINSCALNNQETDLNLIHTSLSTINAFLVGNNISKCYKIDTLHTESGNLYSESVTFADDTLLHHTYSLTYATETHTSVDASGKTTFITRISGTASDDQKNTFDLSGEFIRAKDKDGNEVLTDENANLNFMSSKETVNSFNIHQTYYEQFPNGGQAVTKTKYQYTNLDTNESYYYQWNDQQWKNKIIEFWTINSESNNGYDVKYSTREEPWEGEIYELPVYSVRKHNETNIIKQWEFFPAHNEWREI